MSLVWETTFSKYNSYLQIMLIWIFKVVSEQIIVSCNVISNEISDEFDIKLSLENNVDQHIKEKKSSYGSLFRAEIWDLYAFVTFIILMHNTQCVKSGKDHQQKVFIFVFDCCSLFLFVLLLFAWYLFSCLFFPFS